DPNTEDFISLGNMTKARAYHVAVEWAPGLILIAGGLDATNSPQKSGEYYDDTTGTFTTLGVNLLGQARARFTATLLNNGKVLIAGSADSGTSKVQAELFDPVSMTTANTGNMATARGFHSATLLDDGRVLVAGGLSGAAATATAEIYDPSTGNFSAIANMG